MNARVPSIGSMNQCIGARRPLAFFLGDDAMLRITLDDVRAQHAFDRAIRARHRIESGIALVLDRERAPKVRLRDSSGGAREIEREVFELENRNSFHAAIIEARRSALLVRAPRATSRRGSTRKKFAAKSAAASRRNPSASSW